MDDEIRTLRDGLLEIVKELRSVPKGFRDPVSRLEQALEAILGRTSLGRKREDFARGLRRDSHVYVPRFGEVCRVLKIHKGRREIDVSWGGTPTRLSFEDISWVEPPPPPPDGESEPPP